MKLYILGDSFSSYRQDPRSWITALTAKYDVENFSYAGASNANIFAKFLEIYQRLSLEDAVIISWSDAYRNYDSQRTPKRRTMFETYFFHPTLHRMHDTAYLNRTKELITEYNIRALIVWAFPSDYKFNNAPTSWNEPEFNYIDYNTYEYSVDFENEVKPALIHFSRIEIEKENVSREKILEAYANETRANHIGNPKVHSELVKIVDEFIIGKTSGQINLKQRSS
jgi:hypothetical protein